MRLVRKFKTSQDPGRSRKPANSYDFGYSRARARAKPFRAVLQSGFSSRALQVAEDQLGIRGPPALVQFATEVGAIQPGIGPKPHARAPP